MDNGTFCVMDEYMLEEYVDNTLSKPEKLLIEAHIKNCVHCRKYVTGLKLLIWDLEQAGKEPVAVPGSIKDLSSNIWENISAADRTEKSTARLMLANSASVFKNAFAFTSYMFPTVKPGSILPAAMKHASSIGGKLKVKAINKGSSFFKKSYVGLFGGRS